jgi:hypothetical protein
MRFFTYQKAVDLLPQIIELLHAAIAAKAARQKSESDLAAYKRRLVMSGGAFPNTNRIAAYADQAKTSYEAMKRGIDTIGDLGVQLRDLDQGLIDFPAMYHGQTVYLCFQLGEDSIQHWHPGDEGFSARRPINQEFVDQLDAGFTL